MKHARAWARPVLGATAGAVALVAAPASALAQDDRTPFSSPLAPFSAEAQITARLHALPEPELKTFYLACSRAAARRVLGFGEAAVCSIGYEALLKRSFKGDFTALLAWERTQLTAAPDRKDD